MVTVDPEHGKKQSMKKTEVTENAKAKPMLFTPSKVNRDRLDYGKQLGFEMTSVINEVLEKHLREYLVSASKQKIQSLQKVLSSPMP